MDVEEQSAMDVDVAEDDRVGQVRLRVRVRVEGRIKRQSPP